MEESTAARQWFSSNLISNKLESSRIPAAILLLETGSIHRVWREDVWGCGFVLRKFEMGLGQGGASRAAVSCVDNEEAETN